MLEHSHTRRRVPKQAALLNLALALTACAADDTGAHKSSGEAATPTTGDEGAAQTSAYAHAIGHFAPIPGVSLVDPNVTDATSLDLATASWPIEGEASFRTTPRGVDLELKLTQCRKPYGYPVRIDDIPDCSQLTQDSVAWDGARGTLENKAFCFGSPGVLYESRARDSNQPWTLGGAAASNLIGRTITIHDPDTGVPLACAEIEVADGGALAQPPAPGALPSSTVTAELAGLCVLGAGALSSSSGCPDLDAVADCGLTHCVAPCLPACTDYIACLSSAESMCEGSCQPEAECGSCLGSSTQCMLGFCAQELSCAPPPTPGGPCTELRNCCMRQGPLVESCNRYADLMEELSGDPSCRGALSDWDVNTHFTYRSPCYPDGMP